MKIIWCMVPEMWSATELLVVSGHFLPFYSLTAQKIKILKKWKKNTWRYYHFTQMMVPEIWSVRDRIFCHFRPFLILLPSLPTPLTIWKIKILKKWKKHLDISSFHTSVHKCTEDMENDGQNFLLFWSISSPFTQLATSKIKIFEKMNAWRYHHFTQEYQK